MDPYKVLGLSPNATDDEVKAAYRKLAKKYHPDANPGDKVAEAKMKEVNAAYDMIINHKADPSGAAGTGGAYTGGNPFGGGTYTYGNPFEGFGGFNPFGGFYGSSYQQQEEEEPPRYRAAHSYIRNRRYREALNALNEIPQSERTARWYYYAAQANAGLGNRIAALENAQKAVDMDPGNYEYQSLLNRLQNPGTTYTTYGRGFGFPAFSIGRYCLYLCAFNMCLNLCCRGGRGQGGGGVYCC